MTFKARTQSARQPACARGRADAAPTRPGVPRYLASDVARAAGRAAAFPVSQPGDAHERQAEAMAEALLAKPAPAAHDRGSPDRTPPGQTADSSGGDRLPDDLSSRFGAHLGHDLSGVRIHADGSAAVAARDAGARAYTVGSDIVFGAAEYAPGTPHGDRLIAHEVAHVLQQARTGRPALMRQATPDAGAAAQQAAPAAAPTAPAATGLEALPEATRQALRFDTDEAQGAGSKPAAFFGLKGDIATAKNVDVDYELVTPGIDALGDAKVRGELVKGLRGYALGVFDLLPGDDGKATTTRLNLVHQVNLDLTKWGGPDTAFRFTAIGSTVKGQIKVKLIIEQLAAPFVPLAASEAGVEAAKATPNGLTKAPLMADATWKKVLRALERVPAATLARIRDIEFDNSPDARGAGGEAAEYLSVFKDGKWTRRIVIYADLRTGSDEQFAFTLIHELGHAIDFAPTQGAKGKEKDKEAHHDKAFKDAMQKDGGRAKAITTYGGTSDQEYFAECFAMYQQHPATLKALRPNIHAYFIDFEASAAADAAAKAKAAAPVPPVGAP